MQVQGAILCLGDLWLRWNVKTLKDVTLESLSLVDLVKPTVDLVLLGCGKRIVQPPDKLVVGLRKKAIALETIDTVNAVSTFNLLNQEGRRVMAALLPMGIEQ